MRTLARTERRAIFELVFRHAAAVRIAGVAEPAISVSARLVPGPQQAGIPPRWSLRIRGDRVAVVAGRRVEGAGQFADVDLTDPPRVAVTALAAPRARLADPYVEIDLAGLAIGDEVVHEFAPLPSVLEIRLRDRRGAAAPGRHVVALPDDGSPAIELAEIAAAPGTYRCAPTVFRSALLPVRVAVGVPPANPEPLTTTVVVDTSRDLHSLTLTIDH